MSCYCNQSPCLCVPFCNTECADILEYTASNINLAGIGVFDGLVSQEFQFRGIRSTNTAFLTATLNNALHTIDLEFVSSAFSPTATFANAATRANTIPAFNGQVGVQLDTDTIYVSFGTAAGQWKNEWLLLDGQTLFSNNPNTTLDLSSGGQVTIQSDSAVGWVFQSIEVQFNNNGSLSLNTGSTFHLFSGSVASFDGSTNITTATQRLLYDSVNVPANSLICISSATAGRMDYRATSEFLSIDNTSTYGAPTGALTRTTFNSGTVTLPQLAERVAALITDLQARLLPSP